MNFPTRARQSWTIARIELRRAFLNKRAFWVYFLALFPSVIFIGHGLDVKIREKRWSGGNVTSAALLESIDKGMTDEQVIAKLGEPRNEHTWKIRRGHDRDRPDGETERVIEKIESRNLTYYDGKRLFDFYFEDGKLEHKNSRYLRNFDEDQKVFAAVFQYFYLRLAIFFGCLGIFMNLFRGEMLDKTMHFWFLAPVRREVLLAGKYLAGLIAASVIFTFGTALCFGALLWANDGAEAAAYWQGAGLSHIAWYCAATLLGCVGYGSVFVAAGLLLRNPIIPAAILLVWESINGFLPELLQKLSVLHYVQSLCPVTVPVESDAPPLLKLLLSPAAPASHAAAVFGLLVVTAVVLYAASMAVRRTQINYSTE